jgi:hypothetical protein
MWFLHVKKFLLHHRLLPAALSLLGVFGFLPLLGFTQQDELETKQAQPVDTRKTQPKTFSNPKQYTYPTFNSKQFDQQLELYLNYLEVFDTPDILIVGSSRVLQGVDPIALQQGLTKRGYPEMKIFNFGINGATAQVVDLLLRRVLTHDQLPRMILWADGSRAFNSGRLDITYNGMVASQGYKMLAKGIRPKLPEKRSSDKICIRLPNQHFAIHSGFYFSGELLCGRVDQFSNQLQPIRQLFPKVTNTAIGNGFRQVATRFNPTTYYQRYPKVSGRYDADYRNFNLQGKQAIALQNVLKFTQLHQIPIVVVNLPLTQSYLDPARTEYERQFHQYLQNLAKQKQFIFRDLNQQRQLARNEYFVDPSHLNQFGATAVATYLAKDPHIPWKLANPE